jgi:hypothetical protein
MPETPAANPSQPSPIPTQSSGSAYGVIEREKFPDQLYFYVRKDWSGIVPVEQTEFVGELERTWAVLYAAFYSRRPERFGQYYSRLKALAEMAFNGTTALIGPATSGLLQLKDEVVQNDGVQSKSRHLRGLALAAFIASVLIISVSISVRVCTTYASSNGWISTTQPAESGGSNRSALGNGMQWDQQFSIVHFGILLAATMWGIWLSFALRNMNLSFEQLRNPEADLLSPWMRLAIYGLLAFMLALFFQIRLVSISVGPFSTAGVSQDALIALSLGLILGFSDKVLPAEVRRKVEYVFSKTQIPGNSGQQ